MQRNGERGVYASMDQLFFNDHTIVELADYHYKHGGTHLYLDEVHLYPRPNWEQELKIFMTVTPVCMSFLQDRHCSSSTAKLQTCHVELPYMN